MKLTHCGLARSLTLSRGIVAAGTIFVIASFVGCAPKTPAPTPEDDQRAIQSQIDSLKKSNIPQADKDRAIASLEAQLKEKGGPTTK